MLYEIKNLIVMQKACGLWPIKIGHVDWVNMTYLVGIFIDNPDRPISLLILRTGVAEIMVSLAK